MKASDDTKQVSVETLKVERGRGQTRTRADVPTRSVDDEFWSNARKGDSDQTWHLRT